ncbi:hypothetical protein [Actinomadura litoris]|uniref:Uncharacterized protein n=1 Tax=Actinomadura litoris TaxID=2678616 RepID=A0A7K1LAK0_9ACTN|nr:hypothetical protein [Actinomadura litoris]MUN41452.1 hypothetical protein [Actinomadura litoris]
MSARWDRLAATLAEAGIATEVDRRTWHGETVCRITMRVDGGLITIGDTWRRGRWTGWQVTAEDTDDIVVREFPKTKKRAEVRQHVEEARAVLAS